MGNEVTTKTHDLDPKNFFVNKQNMKIYHNQFLPENGEEGMNCGIIFAHGLILKHF